MKITPRLDACRWDVDECPPKSHRRKDTRKWCRGKVGRKHRVEWQDYVWGYNTKLKSQRLVCTACQKVFYDHVGFLVRQHGETVEAFKQRHTKNVIKRKSAITEKTKYYLDFTETDVDLP